jgi:NADPH:quinone reductase-like Zn-dependent oxidoreductase
VCGSHAGGHVGLDLNWLFRTRATILGASGSSLRVMAEVLAMAGRGEIQPNIHVVLPLTAAGEAFAILYGRHNRGKVVLAVADPAV